MGGGPALTALELAAPAARGFAAPAAPVLAAVGPSMSPHYRSYPPPLYPRVSLRRHEQGTALLLVTIAADGRVLAVSIATSSGYAALDRAALDAVREWTFEPALAAGRTAASQALVPVRFAMSDP